MLMALLVGSVVASLSHIAQYDSSARICLFVVFCGIRLITLGGEGSRYACVLRLQLIASVGRIAYLIR